jgi:hypothetical protein
MKIREIISEAPAGDIGRAVGHTTNFAAKGLGSVIGGVAGAPKRVVKGVKSGAAAFDKLMSPSQWFGGSDDEPSNFEKDTAKNDAVKKSYQDSLTAVSRGVPTNSTDIKNLKNLAAGANLAPEEKAALTAASNRQQLSPEQIAVIKRLITEL